MLRLDTVVNHISARPTLRTRGYVTQVASTVIEAVLPGVGVGTIVEVAGCVAGECRAEVIGFREDRALLVPLDTMPAVAYGTVVEVVGDQATFPVGNDVLGRVLDPLGRPMDGGPDVHGRPRELDQAPPAPYRRSRIRDAVPTGVRAVDGFLTLAAGQRVAIMAGTGVGKSTLLGMITRFSEVDVVVAALVGERGREVREFIDDQLGDEGMKRSVVIAATSDRPSVQQVRAVQSAICVAEHFRDQGKRVLLVVDSLTRLAMAQRQIGLARGEPPTTRGYPPSAFTLIPALLERAGPGEGEGSITAVCTVLVEGDDLQDPIADLVRGVVDGHIVLSRKLADRGHFPAIDVLKSLSRTMPAVVDETHMERARVLRRALAIYQDNEELVRLGAYRRGTDPSVDAALNLYPTLEAFLTQRSSTAEHMTATMAAVEKMSGL